MKKIFKEAMRRYQNWRYRRLYRKLFWFYAKIKLMVMQPVKMPQRLSNGSLLLSMPICLLIGINRTFSIFFLDFGGGCRQRHRHIKRDTVGTPFRYTSSNHFDTCLTLSFAFHRNIEMDITTFADSTNSGTYQISFAFRIVLLLPVRPLQSALASC